jgi:ATP-dependent helicase/nuclease subunit B
VTSSSTIEVSAYNNILRYTAEFIFERFSEQAPDFSKLHVLLPNSQVSQQFHETLCKSLPAQLPAIIPPWAGTLRSWAQQFCRNQQADYQIIGEHARQLLFIEALQQHPDLFKEENKWQVTQSLLSLFDELSLNQQDLFTSANDWQQRLQQAYGIDEKSFDHLQYESKLVYTLWHAWQQQLSENQLYDETADYISRLSNAQPAIENKHFICLGISHYSKTEQDFISYLSDNGQCHIIEFGSTIAADESAYTDTEHPFSALISETFIQSELAIKQRAQRFGENFSEAFSDVPPFTSYMASDEEQQIRAIDYFIRSSIIEGKGNIAVISEDRKLSRRLRALLERADVQLQDRAGWSLATTQAATIIERWLECIEEDFSAYPLLDCLKSPFIAAAQIDSDFKHNIYRFEHDLIFHENVSSNISQYKKQLKNRLQRLTHWPKNSYHALTETLDFIEDSAKALLALHDRNSIIPLSEFLDRLLDSLQQLGVLQNYQNDEAGLVLLKTFDSLKQSLLFSNPALSWQDCRLWLGMALESQHFTPPTSNAGVQLMTLEQAAYQNFDSVVIAAAESQHFPGSAKSSPFFNQAVRASLELNTWEKQRQQRHELFNRTLLSSPEILITACAEEKGEEKPVSPWLELLTSFYRLAFDRSLDDQYLHDLVNSKCEVFKGDDTALPDPSRQAASAIPEDLIPERVSASSYQRVINCPYQYFSADGLQLKPLEELSEELKKSDYGERIHFILQVFHNGHDKYGKAFADEITANNRGEAEDYLRKLSEKVFLADLENNVLHRSWLYRWQKHIPAYINWQIQHQSDWAIFQSEKILETELDSTIKIYGRLDRIDRNRETNSHAIIDYKTGSTARQEDVDIGENVQLSTYALLDEDASEVSYLSVDSSYQKVETRSCLSGDELELNRKHNRSRLIDLFDQMKQKQTLTAWGDDTVCRYCNFSGLCRKAEWAE